MKIPSPTRTFVVSLLGLCALASAAEAQRPGNGRPSGGGGGRPAASRPSSAPVSRPSVSRPTVSRPTASRPAAPAPRPSVVTQRGSAPSPQRGSSSPAPAPAPTPRYEAPSTPRYEAPSTPRYEAPPPRYEAPSTPRYEAPATPRYEAPSAPRTDDAPYRPPSAGPGSRTDRAPGEFGGSRDDGRGWVPTTPGGRIDPAAIDRATPEAFRPRVYQPTPSRDVDLSGAVRQPHIGVPAISGSRSGPEGGLASGRLARAGLDPDRPAAAAPHPRPDDAGFRARYGSGSGASDGAQRAAPTARDATARTGSGPYAGRVRLANASPAVVPLDGSTARGAETTAPERSDAVQRRGEASAGRERTRAPESDATSRGASSDRGSTDRAHAARRRADALAKEDPATAARLGTAVAAGYAAGRVAGEVAGGVVVGTCGGYYGDGWTDGYWDPDAPCWGGTGWYWNSCWTGGWWWSWTWCWPYSGWWWGWNSYYRPWGYGWSSWAWCYSPWAYGTVVYVDDDPDVVVIREEAPAAEVVPAPAAPAAGGAPAKPAPEIRDALAASADEAIAAGDVAFREGRYSDAVRHYARAVEFAPERGALWLILSDALFATGDYHYAAYAFRKSLELDGTLLEPLVDKHAWYGDPAEFDRHVAWPEAYLRDHDHDEDARLGLAANYLFARRYSSAVDALESAFGAGLRETRAGDLVLERARRALGVAKPR